METPSSVRRTHRTKRRQSSNKSDNTPLGTPSSSVKVRRLEEGTTLTTLIKHGIRTLALSPQSLPSFSFSPITQSGTYSCVFPATEIDESKINRVSKVIYSETELRNITDGIAILQQVDPDMDTVIYPSLNNGRDILIMGDELATYLDTVNKNCGVRSKSKGPLAIVTMKQGIPLETYITQIHTDTAKQLALYKAVVNCFTRLITTFHGNKKPVKLPTDIINPGNPAEVLHGDPQIKNLVVFPEEGKVKLIDFTLYGTTRVTTAVAEKAKIAEDVFAKILDTFKIAYNSKNKKDYNYFTRFIQANKLEVPDEEGKPGRNIGNMSGRRLFN